MRAKYRSLMLMDNPEALRKYKTEKQREYRAAAAQRRRGVFYLGTRWRMIVDAHLPLIKEHRQNGRAI